ncbi:MAG: hypothetical protein HKN05_16405 [Rhizobiales bacterium]|nr:hypothetical protein [Hyphomicrobiales bacterium]
MLAFSLTSCDVISLPDHVTWTGIGIIIVSGILVARSQVTARSLIGRRRGRPV